MSTQFDPKSPSIAPSNGEPPSQPKPNPLKQLVNSVYDGYLKETMSPQTYCERAWVQETGTPPSQVTRMFMENCKNDYLAHRSSCQWSRLN